MGISTAVDTNAVARVLGVKTVFKNLKTGVTFLPQRVAIVGQGATASTYLEVKKEFTSAFDVATDFGFGSPVHLAAKQLLPVNGDGIGTIPLTVYPLLDDASGVASAGDITVTGSQTKAASYIVRINNIDSVPFNVAVGDSVTVVAAAAAAAINATLDLPVTALATAGVVDTTSKWEGTSANDIFIEIIGDTSLGTSYAITQHTAGAVNPDVDIALNQVGNVWETMILNCMDVADSASLDKYDVFVEGRWAALVNKPCVVFSGEVEVSETTAIVIPESRKTQRANCQLVEPGSNDLPFVVAAAQLSRIAVLANNDPPHDYGSQDAPRLTPGTDAQQWDAIARELAVQGGSSTIEVKDGVVNISDVVTFYHPDGEVPPAYRYVVDIVKLQNILFNIALKFNTAEYDGAPLIPDNQPTTNRSAKSPKTAKMDMAAIIDALGLAAIISDPETAKASILAEIDSGNPKRLNLVVTVQLSGNTNIKSIDLNFGFFFS